MRVTAHGLVIDSDVDLHVDRPTTAPADVMVRQSEARPVPSEVPAGEVLVRLVSGGIVRFALVRDEAGLLLHFAGLARARIDTSLSEVVVHLDPRADPGMAAVLLNGYVATVLLTARGHRVLHGTAYAVQGRAVALVGASGMGKSTAGVLACRSGARLVSDDVLRVAPAPGGDGWVCWPGTTESRLRPAAASLALPDGALTDGGLSDGGLPDGGLPDGGLSRGDGSAPGAWSARSRSTADGRTAVTPVTTGGGAPLPLVEVLVPAPSRDATSPRFEPLTGAGALLELSRYPRLVGVEHPGWLRAQFEGLGALVRSVPVARAVLPWGPPWPASTGAALVDRATAVDLRDPAAPADHLRTLGTPR